MQIKDSVVFVTGANRGIGRAFVETLLESGASRVYASARNLSTLDALVVLDPRRVRAIELDVTDAAAARAAAGLAQDVTLLINNAAIATLGAPTQVSL